MILKRPSQQQLKIWEKLHMTKYRMRERLMLAEGEKIVRELLKSPWRVESLLLWKNLGEGDTGHLNLGLPTDVEAYRLTMPEGKRLTQDDNPEGIMAVVTLPEENGFDTALLKDTGRILLLNRINNPNNLGSVIRTAHWFGFSCIVLSRDSVDYTNPKVVRSSMGSIFHVRIISDVDFAEALPVLKKTHMLVGTHVKNGAAPRGCPEKTALLLGSESHGLPKDFLALADERWCIAGSGGAESLSLPQAAAIMMYACTK